MISAVMRCFARYCVEYIIQDDQTFGLKKINEGNISKTYEILIIFLT